MINRLMIICLSGTLLSAVALADQDRAVDVGSTHPPAQHESADQVRAEGSAQREQSARTRTGPVRWMAPEALQEKRTVAASDGGGEPATDSSAKVEPERVQHRQEFGQAQGNRTRWMAPEAIQEKRRAATDVAAGNDAATQTRDEDDKGNTDKSSAARARNKGSVPCPLPVGGADPTGSASGAASATNGGCGNP